VTHTILFPILSCPYLQPGPRPSMRIEAPNGAGNGPSSNGRHIQSQVGDSESVARSTMFMDFFQPQPQAPPVQSQTIPSPAIIQSHISTQSGIQHSRLDLNSIPTHNNNNNNSSPDPSRRSSISNNSAVKDSNEKHGIAYNHTGVPNYTIVPTFNGMPIPGVPASFPKRKKFNSSSSDGDSKESSRNPSVNSTTLEMNSKIGHAHALNMSNIFSVDNHGHHNIHQRETGLEGLSS
jgi:hypothetical protein